MGGSMSKDRGTTKSTSNSDDDRILAELREKTPAIAETLERWQQHVAAAQKEPQPNAPAKIIQLPFWADPVRGVPNALLRSAFFAAIHSKKRRQLGIQKRPEKPPEGIIIAAQKGDVIKFAGTQLNQYDADVFFEALHRARLHPLGTECAFRGYDFLKNIRRQHGNHEYEDLDDSLTRLRDGRVEIYSKINGSRCKFVGGLISTYKREDNSKLYKVTFAKEIIALFAPSCWTQLEWEERMALKGKPLAQWLHSFYSTHVPTPFPLSAAYLHDKTGSARPLLKHFKQDLKKALETLEKELGWKATWADDLLTLKRPPTPSQARHLRSANRKRLPKPPRLTSDALFSGTN
jgi:hypothetical protein